MKSTNDSQVFNIDILSIIKLIKHYVDIQTFLRSILWVLGIAVQVPKSYNYKYIEYIDY